MSNSDSMGDGPPSKKPRVGDEGKKRAKQKVIFFNFSLINEGLKGQNNVNEGPNIDHKALLSYVKSYIFDNYWYLYEENRERNAYV